MPKPYRRADARGRDERLRSVLKEMLERGERISARGVLKHVPDLRAPSSLTRDPVRRSLLEEFRQLQSTRNAWVERAKKQSTARLQRLLAERDDRVRELEHHVQVLVGSHRALMVAVGELGGLPVWRKAFAGYERCLKDLALLGALPARSKPSPPALPPGRRPPNAPAQPLATVTVTMRQASLRGPRRTR
jgi:hypothetical protein